MKVAGVLSKNELLGRGVERAQIRRWERSGAVRSVGSWYVTDEAPADLVALLARGLRPACLDAAALHGLWVPPHEGTHVFRPRCPSGPVPAEAPARPIRPGRPAPGAAFAPPLAEAGLRREDLPMQERRGGWGRPQMLVMHAPWMRAWPDDDPVPSLLLALEQAARCLPVVKTAILIESALNLRRMDRGELASLLGVLPARLARPLARVRDDVQSGTETRVRWWLESHGVEVRSQVQLLPDVRVDLLVGRDWVIECDSRRFHDDPARYAEDRRRDLALAARGFRVTRLTWEQVMLDWDATQACLSTILSRRRHR